MIAQELLDELWDFADPAGSESRFAAAEGEAARTDAERAELVTQRARALGLQRRFEEAQELLDGLGEVADVVVETRIALEAGRLRNSAGRPDEASVLFEDAAQLAAAAGLAFLEIDALHMLAICDPPRAAEWTRLGIERAMAAADDRTRRWLVSLHNNRGWALRQAGEPAAARAAFLEAQHWAEELGTPQQRQWAREALDELDAGAGPGAEPHSGPSADADGAGR